ncbi:MAG: alpha-1,2-fucosyltransferase [Mariniphaga sp.]
MIIVKLLGGLGNQMFQYATGLSLAHRNNAFLKLDIGELVDRTPKPDFTYRDFELDYFDLQPCFSTPQDKAIFFQDNSLLKKKIIDFKKKLGVIHIHCEKSMTFDPGVLSAGANTYLSGYWQCEKYFMDVKDLVVDSFSLRSEFLDAVNDSPVLGSIRDQISNSQSVSVHFRRGDYINNSMIGAIHGICSAEYYDSAIKYFSSISGNIRFFLFSDDPEWVLENVKIPFPFTVIPANPGYADLYLMSLCKHNIIANSSFSWWGAWLNKNPDKIVIAPQKWFRDAARNRESTDIVPLGWLRF